MLSLFRPRRHAAIARGMLALWLFVLVQGIANACLLQTAGRSAQQAVQAPAHEHADDHAHATDGHADALCVDACDQRQDSLPSKGGSMDLDPGPAALPCEQTWPLAWTAALSTDAVASEAEPVHGPPPRIRFLRLSL